jgi:predicted PurR-regulated permease PerM
LAWDGCLILALIALVWLAAQVKGFTVPFLVAFIVAYMLDPVVDRFEAASVGRTLAIGIILGLFLVVGGLVFVLVVPQIVREFSLIPGKLSLFLASAEPWLESTLNAPLPDDLSSLVDALMAELGSNEASSLLKPAGTVASLIFGGTASVLSAVVALVMIPIFAFFLLRDFDIIVAKIGDLIPTAYRPFVEARMHEIDETLSSFVRGQLTVSGVLVVLYSLGLWAVGLPLALVIGLVTGIGNLIPYLGTSIGILLAAVMLLLDWQGWGHVGAVAAVFGVIQLLEGWVITPRLVGDSVGLSTLAVIVAVMVFSELFGFYGVLVAVPAAAVLKILFREVVDAYRASSFFQEG